MDFEQLYEIIFRIYTDCNVTEFPLIVLKWSADAGYRIKRYSELTPRKRRMRLSPDACIVKDTLYYQDQNIPERTRFQSCTNWDTFFSRHPVEETADTFSSHILAPRIMIHKNGCQNAEQIHETFGLSTPRQTAPCRITANGSPESAAVPPETPLAVEQKLESMFRPLPEEPASRPSRRRPAKKRLTKRQRGMDERAAFSRNREVDLWEGLCVPHAGRAVVMRKCTVIKARSCF